MYVKHCPVCGNYPRIEDFYDRDKVRRYLCGCPRYCSVIHQRGGNKGGSWETHSWFITEARDNNEIYKLWNKCVDRYNANVHLDYSTRDYSVIDPKITF